MSKRLAVSGLWQKTQKDADPGDRHRQPRLVPAHAHSLLTSCARAVTVSFIARFGLEVKMVRFAIALLFVIGTAAVVSGPAGPFRTVNVRAADAPATSARDILRILQKNCQSCHRPGQIAPMSLLTYQDARPWARS